MEIDKIYKGDCLELMNDIEDNAVDCVLTDIPYNECNRADNGLRNLNKSKADIGDFDLEYLLNKSGSIRLKAYNRYNDQNFYVKTATTTQGIGIVYRRDFDHVLSFLHKLKSQLRKNSEAKLQNDSTKVNNNK